MKEKEPHLVAGMIHRLQSDPALREQVVRNQRIRLQELGREPVKKQFEDYMRAYLKG